jgi:hypothetical protein
MTFDTGIPAVGFIPQDYGDNVSSLTSRACSAPVPLVGGERLPLYQVLRF